MHMLNIPFQSIVFFLGNYETTTTTLCFTAYLLATNPEVQERLIAEIDDVIGDRTKLTYQDVSDLTYLDMVLHEAMRVYPPAIEYVNHNGRIWNARWQQ